MRKIISLILSFGLLFQQVGFAQVALELNIANYLSMIGSNIVQEKFRPIHLRYFSYDSLNDNFKVLLDKGGIKNLKTPELESSTKRLLSYFLIGVTLPDSMFWVNLRPDSEDQIIDPYLEKTDVGKIMLEADLQLKKDTALYTSPQTPEGKEYWNRLYKKAGEIFSNENIEIPTLTRPWIVPGEIILRESKDSAYVYKANLKVMLEQDYLKGSTTYNFKDERSKALNEYSSQLIRELIIPKLTKEVNSSKRYAPLRQVYYSLILSRWFKLRFTGKTGTYASLINTGNLTNLVSQELRSKTEYFKQYQKSFSQGEYNIKEPVYTPTGQVIRSYFSGGINVAAGAINTQNGFGGGKTLSPAFLDKAGVLMEGNSVGGIKTFAASPIKTSDEKSASSALTQEEGLTKLSEEIFEGQLRSLYGKGKVEAASINPYLSKIGFDYDDKKEPNRLGWTIANLEWILQNPEKVQSVLDDAQIIRDNFKYVIFCGMGGSGLSVQVVKDTFAEKKVKIYSLRTTDPQIIKDILNEIALLEGSLEAALGKTLVIPVSKSGTTQETVSHKQYFERIFKKFLIDVKKHLWVVTDKGSPMDTGDYIQREIQLNGKGDIGGRFTAPTTNVFLLPLAIVAPERVMDILRITQEMNEMNEIKDIKQDIFLKLGAYLYYMAADQGKDKITMFMPEELKDIPLWAEQLFEESLGKDGKGVTLFYGEKLSPKELKPVGQNDRVFLRINIGGRNTR